MPDQNFSATILVTGANGQLANEIKTLSKNYPSYHFLFTAKEELSINDTQSIKSFFEKNQIDYCINCAAYTAVDKAESEKEKAFEINADAVGELAKICHDNQVKLIHISTDYVYDGSPRSSFKRRLIPLARLMYMARQNLKENNLHWRQNPSTLIIRTSWVYSSFGNNFVKTMLRLFKEKEEINVIDDQLGSPTYAADLAAVILVFIEKNARWKIFFRYCKLFQ